MFLYGVVTVLYDLYKHYLFRCILGYDVVYSKDDTNYTSVLGEFTWPISHSTSFVYIPDTKPG